jgi:hypothetical protein
MNIQRAGNTMKRDNSTSDYHLAEASAGQARIASSIFPFGGAVESDGIDTQIPIHRPKVTAR